MSLIGNSSIEYLTFYVNKVLFAIDSVYIESINKLHNITEVPKSDKTIDGIVSFRDSTIPVINLGGCLFSKYNEINKDDQYIICLIENKSVAFRVDSIKGMIKVDKDNIIPVNAIFRNTCDVIENFIMDNDKSIIEILSVKSILQHYKSI